MNDVSLVKSFAFEDLAVRIEVFDGEPWWVARDVSLALGYAPSCNITSLIDKVPEEWKGGKRIATPGGVQEMLCLSEQGLFFFLARSDKPKALPFQMWIAGEVLPQIRRTGAYAVQRTREDMFLEAAQILVEQRRRQDALEQEQRAIVQEQRAIVQGQAQLSERMQAIEGRREAAQQALFAMPKPDVTPPVLSTRMQIVQAVRQYCEATGEEYSRTWGAIYREVRDRLHLDLAKRAKALKLSTLDYAEQLDAGLFPGLLQQMYAIAYELFTSKLKEQP